MITEEQRKIVREEGSKWITNCEDSSIIRMFGHHLRSYEAGYELANAEISKLKEKIDAYSRLKVAMVKTFRKIGDKKFLAKGFDAFTGNDLANEVEANSEEGDDQMNAIVRLTIDLLLRDKIHRNELTDKITSLEQRNKELEEENTQLKRGIKTAIHGI